MDRVDDIEVLLNGVPTPYAEFTSYVFQNGQTNWGVGVYFDRLASGTYTIQLLTTLRTSDVLAEDTPYLVVSNLARTITVANTVTFTNWDALILSNTYTLSAQSSITTVDWEIDIYDVNNHFVKSQTGHSDDGNIQWTWDLTDSTGASRTSDADPFFYPYLTLAPSSGGTNITGWTPPLAGQFPSQGSWLFAYLDKFYDNQTANYAGADSYYLPAVQNMEGGPALWNFTAWDYPIAFGTNYSQAERDQSWDTLAWGYLSLWPIRNFYYFGHGAPDSIGGDISTLDSSNNITGSKLLPKSKAQLTSQWVREKLSLNPWGPIPFRFVFLDGCNTANGGWPAAWGVPKQVETLDYYQGTNNVTHARPSAFVGWDVEIGGRKDWGTVDKFWQFRQVWMGRWSVQVTTGETLRQAFDDAFNNSNWVDRDHYNHMQIFGYQNMTFLEYNHRGDWP